MKKKSAIWEVATTEREEVEFKIIAKLCFVSEMKNLKIIEDVIDTALRAEEYNRKKLHLTDVDGCSAFLEE